MENSKDIIENEKCSFSFNDSTKEIYGACRLDLNNEPRCYNRNKQSYKKAKEAFKKEFKPEMSMFDAMNILCKFKMNMRSYCAMD